MKQRVSKSARLVFRADVNYVERSSVIFYSRASVNCLVYSSRYQGCADVESKEKLWSVTGNKYLLDLMSVE